MYTNTLPFDDTILNWYVTPGAYDPAMAMSVEASGLRVTAVMPPPLLFTYASVMVTAFEPVFLTVTAALVALSKLTLVILSSSVPMNWIVIDLDNRSARVVPKSGVERLYSRLVSVTNVNVASKDLRSDRKFSICSWVGLDWEGEKLEST